MDTKQEVTPEVNPESLKVQGNNAVQKNSFTEAVLLYSLAIKLDPEDYTLYSNRSYAYLKLGHYNYALKDAKDTIALNPSWPKGYFRKGEVEYAAGHYMAAHDSYREALKWRPEDVTILAAFNKAAKGMLKQQNFEKEIPWVGAGVGIIIGVTILVAEFLVTKNPTHPLLMAFITIAISFIGYGIARAYRAHAIYQRNSLLEPPSDSEQNDIKEEEKEEIRRTPRYSKSEARLRYRKGKA